MKGYKAFDKNLQCRGMQYEVGKTYTIAGNLKICGHGLHFCEKLESVYGYYGRSSDTRICEVEAIGPVQTEGDKSATLSLRIIRELSHKEMLDAILKGCNSGNYNSGHYNSGDYNSGYRNSGYRNSGHYNSGNYNSGYYNSGHYNSGHYNSGDCNSGHYNSGDYNSGYRNSGYRNSGDCNSGHYNSGDYNSGYFNSNTPFVRLFNKSTKLRWDGPKITKLNLILNKVKPILRWVSSGEMTEEEKSQFPSHKTTGGFLKKTNRTDWSRVTQSDFEFIRTLPNFNKEVFKACTGFEFPERK